MEPQHLATVVAPIDPKLTRRLISEQPAPQQADARFGVVLVTGLTLLALLIHGYHPYADDGGLYLAGIKRLLNPALYPHSTGFVLEPTRFSLFARTIALVVRCTRIPVMGVVFALHLASMEATLYAAWMLAARCWASRAARSGAVLLLAIWLGLPVAGTALAIMDPYLTARSFSTPCTLLALAGMIDLAGLGIASPRRGLLLSLAALAIAAVMHPLMASYALGAALLLLCLCSKNHRVRRLAPLALVSAAFTVALLVSILAKPAGAASRSVELTRTYWFPAEWAWYELVGLAAPLLILSIFAFFGRRDSSIPAARSALARMALAVGATSCLIVFTFSRTSAQSFLIAQIQPLRMFHVVYLVLVIFLGAVAGEGLLRRSPRLWAAAAAILAAIMLVAARSSFPASNHLELPWRSPQNRWEQAFFWVRDNTPTDALFALDADYINAAGEDAQCFRALAERSSLPDYSKDGGEASIAPAHASQWQAGVQAQQQLSAPSMTDTERISSLAPLGVTWIILDAKAVTRFTCPYDNASVKVCRLR